MMARGWRQCLPKGHQLSTCCGCAVVPGWQSIWDSSGQARAPTPTVPEPGACFYKERVSPSVPQQLAARAALQAALLAPAASARVRADAAAALAHAPLQRALLCDPRALYPRLSALAPAPAPAGVYPPLCVLPVFSAVLCPPTNLQVHRAQLFHPLAGDTVLCVQVCSGRCCAKCTIHTLHCEGILHKSAPGRRPTGSEGLLAALEQPRRRRLLGLSIASGRLCEAPPGGSAEAASAAEALMARLLGRSTAAATPLLWLLLRLLLDAQARRPGRPDAPCRPQCTCIPQQCKLLPCVAHVRCGPVSAPVFCMQGAWAATSAEPVRLRMIGLGLGRHAGRPRGPGTRRARQVMLAALRRSAAAGEAAAAAAGAYAEAQAGVARVAEAEKAFTSRARSPAREACRGACTRRSSTLSLPKRPTAKETCRGTRACGVCLRRTRCTVTQMQRRAGGAAAR